MKQFLIFGVIVLIQVNLISCVNPRTRTQGDENNSIQFEDVDMEPFEEIEDEPNTGLYRPVRSIPYNTPEEDLLRSDLKSRTKRAIDSSLIPECTFDECEARGRGDFATEKCSNIYCVCKKEPGQAYLQSCPLGYIFHADIKICVYRNIAVVIGYCAE